MLPRLLPAACCPAAASLLLLSPPTVLPCRCLLPPTLPPHEPRMPAHVWPCSAALRASPCTPAWSCARTCPLARLPRPCSPPRHVSRSAFQVMGLKKWGYEMRKERDEYRVKVVWSFSLALSFPFIYFNYISRHTPNSVKKRGKRSFRLIKRGKIAQLKNKDKITIWGKNRSKNVKFP